MIEKTVSVYLGASRPPVILDCTEGDTMWRWRIQLFLDNQRWTIPAGSTVKFVGCKADGNVFDTLQTLDSAANEAVVDCDIQMTAVPGPAACVLQIHDSAGKIVASCPIILSCKPSPQSMGTRSDTVLPAYLEVLQRLAGAETAAQETLAARDAAHAAAQVAAVAAETAVEIAPSVLANAEAAAASAAAAAESARTLTIDATLTQRGQAADAAAVGALKSALKSGEEADAAYHLGFYLDANGDLCQVEDE